MKKFKSAVEKELKTFLSPTFILILVLSFGLWYVSKLRYTYRTEVPVFLNVENNRFKVICTAEGTGYQIIAYKFFSRRPKTLTAKELNVTPSAVNPDSYVIDKLLLQNYITLQTRDLRILAVDNVPEISIPK